MMIQLLPGGHRFNPWKKCLKLFQRKADNFLVLLEPRKQKALLSKILTHEQYQPLVLNSCLCSCPKSHDVLVPIEKAYGLRDSSNLNQSSENLEQKSKMKNFAARS